MVTGGCSCIVFCGLAECSPFVVSRDHSVAHTVATERRYTGWDQDLTTLQGGYMSPNSEAALAIVAALLVLFSAMIDPRISAGVAVILLLAFAAFKFIRKT